MKPTMRPIAPGERERMQDHHAGAMKDRCIILRWNGTAHVSEETTTPCRFVEAAPEGVFLSSAATAGATFHLPAGTELGIQDRIQLVAQRGGPVPPTTYIQAGRFVMTPLATVVDVREKQG